jgi:hypothetical protein
MIKLKDLLLEQSLKWKRVSAGEYEAKTDKGTYRIRRVGGRMDGTPIQWNVYDADSRDPDDAENTMASAKYLAQMWYKNQ